VATLWQPLTIQQGDTFKFIVAITGGPADLTGYTTEMAIKGWTLTDEVLLHLSDGDGLTLDTALRRVTIEIDEAVTGALDWIHPARYDLHLEGAEGRWRLMEGTVSLSHTVTV